MKLKKSLAIALSLILIMTLFTACGGGGGGAAADYSADNPIVFRLASDAPIEHMSTTLNNELVDLVKEKTEGRVQIEYYPASQLGSYETVYEEVMLGAIDAAQITVPDSSDARLGAAYLPYYATGFEDGKKLYGTDSYMVSVMKEICATQNVNFVGFVCEGFIGMGVAKDPKAVFEPGVAKGIALRSPAMATFRQVQEDLGYTPTTIVYAEVPTALQTGVVDGWIGGTANMNYSWVGEIINKFYYNYLHLEATAYVVSEQSLDKLTDADREIVLGCFEQMSNKSFDVAEENEAKYRQKLADDYGVEVVVFDQEQLDTAVKFVRETTWPKLEELLTPELMDGFRKEVGMK
ncbi:MAG: TRAP transporter substrate-binding protein DctP [Clostridia bacterium]|nr:TRAP transporter substrate-binding protein DctP [Clostridia bacterium]